MALKLPPLSKTSIFLPEKAKSKITTKNIKWISHSLSEVDKMSIRQDYSFHNKLIYDKYFNKESESGGNNSSRLPYVSTPDTNLGRGDIYRYKRISSQGLNQSQTHSQGQRYKLHTRRNKFVQSNSSYGNFRALSQQIKPIRAHTSGPASGAYNCRHARLNSEKSEKDKEKDMEHSQRTNFLQKIEKAIKSDNGYLLKKTLKLDLDQRSGKIHKKSNFLPKELQAMRLPKNILHFTAEAGALECFRILLNQDLHNLDVNFVHKGETVLSRLILLASQKLQFSGMQSPNDYKELIKQKKKLQQKQSSIVGKGLGVSQAGADTSMNDSTSSLLPTEIAVEMVKEIAEIPECDFNLPRVDGWRPLMIASYLGCTEVCRILIENRSVSSDLHNVTPTQSYITLTGEPIQKQQPKPADINFYNSEGLNCVHVASANGNSETTAYLIEKNSKFLNTCEYGIDYNAKEMSHGFTPFLVAAVNCQTSTAEAILNIQRQRLNTNLDKIASKVKLGGNSRELMKNKVNKVFSMNRFKSLPALQSINKSGSLETLPEL